MKKELDENTKKKIIAIISALIPDAKIYLFGSRARGTNSNYSDIDLALDTGYKISNVDLDELKTIFKVSYIMYEVDLLDMNNIDDLIKNQILKDRILWK